MNPCNDLSSAPFEFTAPASQASITNNNFDGAVVFQLTEFTIVPSYCTADYTLTAIAQDGSTSSIPLADLSLDGGLNL